MAMNTNDIIFDYDENLQLVDFDQGQSIKAGSSNFNVLSFALPFGLNATVYAGFVVANSIKVDLRFATPTGETRQVNGVPQNIWAYPIDSAVVNAVTASFSVPLKVSFVAQDITLLSNLQTNKGTFGSTFSTTNGDLPTVGSATEGDFYSCDLDNFFSAEANITFKISQIAVLESGVWVLATQYQTLAPTEFQTLAVSSAFIAQDNVAPITQDELILTNQTDLNTRLITLEQLLGNAIDGYNFVFSDLVTSYPLATQIGNNARLYVFNELGQSVAITADQLIAGVVGVDKGQFTDCTDLYTNFPANIANPADNLGCFAGVENIGTCISNGKSLTTTIVNEKVIWNTIANNWLPTGETYAPDNAGLQAEIDALEQNKQDKQDNNLDSIFGADDVRTIVNAINQLLAEKFDKLGGVITGDVVVTGSFEIQGTPTIVESTIVKYSDNILDLNSEQEGTPSVSLKAGLRIILGDLANQSFIYDNNDKVWKLGVEGAEQEIALQITVSGIRTDVGDPANLNTINKVLTDAVSEVNDKVNANTTEIDKIKDGTTVVKKAEQDKNGNDIVDTYATKDENSLKISGMIIQDDGVPVGSEAKTINAGAGFSAVGAGDTKTFNVDNAIKALARIDAVVPQVITTTPTLIDTVSTTQSNDLTAIEINGDGDTILKTLALDGSNFLLQGDLTNTVGTTTTITIEVLRDGIVDSALTLPLIPISSAQAPDNHHFLINLEVPKVVVIADTVITFRITADQAGATLDSLRIYPNNNSGLSGSAGTMKASDFDTNGNLIVDDMDYDNSNNTLTAVTGNLAIDQVFNLHEALKNYLLPTGTTAFILNIPHFDQVEGATVKVTFPDVVVQGNAFLSVDNNVTTFEILDIQGNNIDAIGLQSTRAEVRRQITPGNAWIIVARDVDLSKTNEIVNKLDIVDFEIKKANDSEIIENNTNQLVIKDENNQFISSIDLIKSVGDSGKMTISSSVTQLVSDGNENLVVLPTVTPNTVDFSNATANTVTMLSAIPLVNIAVKYSVRGFNLNANNTLQGTFQIYKNDVAIGNPILTKVLNGSNDDVNRSVVQLGLTSAITDEFTLKLDVPAINGDRGIEILNAELILLNPVVSTNYLIPQENVEGLKNIPAFLTNNTETFPTFPSTPSEGSQIGAKVTILEATNELGTDGNMETFTGVSPNEVADGFELSVSISGEQSNDSYLGTKSQRLFNPASAQVRLQTKISVIPSILNDVWYASAYFKSQNGDDQRRIAVTDNSIVTLLGFTSANIDGLGWTRLTTRAVDTVGDGFVRLLCYNNASTNAENNDTLIDGAILVNLTQGKVYDSQGNEISQAQADDIFPYFDNTTQTKVRHISRPSNIFNKNVGIQPDSVLDTNGDIVPSVGDFAQDVYIRVQSGTQYILSNDAPTVLRLLEYDINKNFVDRTAVSASVIVKTLNVLTEFVRISGTSGIEDTLELELGNTRTTPLVVYDQTDNTITSTEIGFVEENGVKYLGGDTYVEILDGFIGGLTDYTIATDLASKVDANSQAILGLGIDKENNIKDIGTNASDIVANDALVGLRIIDSGTLVNPSSNLTIVDMGSLPFGKYKFMTIGADANLRIRFGNASTVLTIFNFSSASTGSSDITLNADDISSLSASWGVEILKNNIKLIGTMDRTTFSASDTASHKQIMINDTDSEFTIEVAFSATGNIPWRLYRYQ